MSLDVNSIYENQKTKLCSLGKIEYCVWHAVL